MLNLLAIPAWSWVVSALILVAAVAIIVLIILWDKKIIGFGKNKGGSSSGSSDGETAASEKKSKTAKTAKTTKTTTPAQTSASTASSEKKTAKPAQTSTKTTAATPAAQTAAKPSGKVYHISKRKEDGMWQIKAAGAEKAIKLFKTQKEAIDYCKTLAGNQDASIMIHKEDGSFRKLTY